MPQKLLEAVAQNTRLRVVNLLKRTQGLSVPELARHLDMSYMGVKEVCQDLERRGLLDNWREPKAVGSTGRPRIVYRLTGKAHELFAAASHSLTLELLDAAKKLHGPSAAEKLLMLTWQQKAGALAPRIKGSQLRERAESLARLRDAEGHMAVVEQQNNTLRIVEHHCPYLDVLRAYPLVAKLDAELFRRLLDTAVRREESTAAGLYRADFHLG